MITALACLYVKSMLNKRINLEEEKKSLIDMHLEMLQNANSKNYKRQDGCREEMSKDANGNMITGKLPEYVITTEGLPGNESYNVQKLEENSRTSSLPNYNKLPRDLLPQKGLQDTAREILQAPYIPQPHMVDNMK